MALSVEGKKYLSKMRKNLNDNSPISLESKKLRTRNNRGYIRGYPNGHLNGVSAVLADQNILKTFKEW